MTAEAFIADVARSDAVLKVLPGWSPLPRFPYLKEGSTAEKRDAIRFLDAGDSLALSPQPAGGTQYMR